MPLELVHDRSSRVSAKVLGAAALESRAGDWDRLAANALEENPLYSRAFVTAGLDELGERNGFLALGVVRADEAGIERLIGLLPLRRTRFRYGLPTCVDLGARNLFQPNGTPLIDRDHAAEAIDGLLGALGGPGGLAPNLLLGGIRRDGAFARVLLDRGGSAGLEATVVETFSRPVLRPVEADAESYLTRHVAPKRLRELRRTHRRLTEQGSLAYRHVETPAEIRAAVEDFLRIELSGWKGQARTALLSRPETAAFGRAAFSGLNAGSPIASADVLALDGSAIAVSLNLQIGRTCFALKCAYDESLRRFSPGLVLEYLVIEHLFSSRFADEMDSCVTQGGHVIQDLWDGAEEIGTLALARRGSRIGLGPIGLGLAEAETRRARLRSHAKERYIAAREMVGDARAMLTGEDRSAAKAMRARLDASSKRAMMTFTGAQPNGEFAAVLTTMI